MSILQKAGFMLVELAFASSVRDRRHVVILVSTWTVLGWGVHVPVNMK